MVGGEAVYLRAGSSTYEYKETVDNYQHGMAQDMFRGLLTIYVVDPALRRTINPIQYLLLNICLLARQCILNKIIYQNA